MNSIREVSRLPSAIMRKTSMHRDATGLQAVNTVAVCCSERDAAGKGSGACPSEWQREMRHLEGVMLYNRERFKDIY